MVAYMQAEQDDDLPYVIESSGKESSSGKEDSGLVRTEVSEHSAEHSEEHSYKAEVIAQIRLAAPVCCTFLMRKSVDIVSVMFVGRLGSHYLSAAGIAAVTSNVSGNSMIVGLAGALSTICSQVIAHLTDTTDTRFLLPKSKTLYAIFRCDYLELI